MNSTAAGTRSVDTRARRALVVAGIALFVDMLVYGLAVPVLPLLPAVVKAGPAAAGILFAGYAIAVILVTPLVGRMVDRRGPRRPLLVGLGGLAAATVLFSFGGPFPLLVAARVMQGAAAGVSWVAALSLIAATTPQATRGRSMGIALSVISLGTLLGPPLGGLLAQRFNPAVPFLVAAALALGDGVLRVLLIPQVDLVTDDPVGPVTVLRQPGAWSVTLVVAISAALIAAVEPLLGPHLHQVAHTGASGVGLVFAAAVVCGAVVNPVAGQLATARGSRLPVLLGLLVAPAALVALGMADQVLPAALAMSVLGLGIGLMAAPASLLIGQLGQRCVPSSIGGAYALYNLAYAAGLALGPLASGGLTSWCGYQSALITVAGIAGAILLASVPRLPKIVGSKELGPSGQASYDQASHDQASQEHACQEHAS